MSRITKAWAMVSITAIGLATCAVYPPAGVGIACVGQLATTFAAFALNVPASRLAISASALLNAAALYWASQSPMLALAPIIAGLAIQATELVLRRWRTFFDWQMLLGGTIGIALMAASWRSGFWLLAAAPPVLLTTMLGSRFPGMTKYATETLKKTPLRIGEPFPDVDLPYRDGGGRFSLKDQRGTYVLLVFVRGDWCPFCHVMMRILSIESGTLEKHGVKLVMVTPSSGKLEEDFVSGLELKTRFVYDEGAATAHRLALLDKDKKDGADVPLPVALLIDREGRLRSITRPDDVSAYSSEKKILAALDAPPVAAAA